LAENIAYRHDDSSTQISRYYTSLPLLVCVQILIVSRPACQTHPYLCAFRGRSYCHSLTDGSIRQTASKHRSIPFSIFSYVIFVRLTDIAMFPIPPSAHEDASCKKGSFGKSAFSVFHLKFVEFFSNYQLNAHFLYSITIYMLHYNPQHVSSSTMFIFRRTNCIITASGIATLCKQYAGW